VVTDFIALDVETANANFASICAIGLVHFRNGEVFKSLTILVDPEDEFDAMNIGIHGISPEDVVGKPTMAQVLPVISSVLSDVVVVHHSHFDKSALNRAAIKYGTGPLPCIWLDTLRVARRAWPHLDDGGGYGLARLASEFSINFRHHDAADDAKAAGLLMLRAISDSGFGLEKWLERVELTLSGEVPGRYAREGDPSGPFAGETICFTGALVVPRSVASRAASDAGCNVSDGVNKKTTILVVGDQDLKRTRGQEKSSKHRKAEDLIAKGASLRIVGESDFMEMVGLDASPDADGYDEPAPTSRPYLTITLSPEATRIEMLVESVRHLKRTGDYEEALKLLHDEMDKQEREAAKSDDVAPWYYEHAAIIYRKIGQPDQEIAVLERYMAQPKFRPTIGDYLTERLQKAKIRAAH
jgi:DNA polymerase-3 subunit epsilon